MNISDSLKLMMKEAHMTNQSLANMCGQSSTGSVTTVKANNAARISKFCQLAGFCGYRLYTQSLKTGELTRISGTKPAPDNEKTAMDMCSAMREEAGLSYPQLAKRLGYSVASGKDYESSGGLGTILKRNDMDLNRFLRIAEVCEFKVLLRPVVLNSRLPIYLHYEPSRYKQSRSIEQEDI